MHWAQRISKKNGCPNAKHPQLKSWNTSFPGQLNPVSLATATLLSVQSIVSRLREWFFLYRRSQGPRQESSWPASNPNFDPFRCKDDSWYGPSRPTCETEHSAKTLQAESATSGTAVLQTCNRGRTTTWAFSVRQMAPVEVGLQGNMLDQHSWAIL